MTPAQPPLPTAWYLPFQPVAGSQTSTLMSESADGASVAATRQCAGSIRAGAAGAPPLPAAGAAGGGPPARPGGTNGPAGTSSVDVIVVLASFSDFKSAHGVAASAGAAMSNAAAVRTPFRITAPLKRITDR